MHCIGNMFHPTTFTSNPMTKAFLLFSVNSSTIPNSLYLCDRALCFWRDWAELHSLSIVKMSISKCRVHDQHKGQKGYEHLFWHIHNILNIPVVYFFHTLEFLNSHSWIPVWCTCVWCLMLHTVCNIWLHFTIKSIYV